MLSIAYLAFFEVDRCKKDLQAVLHEPSSYQEVANIIPVCTCFHLPLPIDTCIVCVCVNRSGQALALKIFCLFNPSVRPFLEHFGF